MTEIILCNCGGIATRTKEAALVDCDREPIGTLPVYTCANCGKELLVINQTVSINPVSTHGERAKQDAASKIDLPL